MSDIDFNRLKHRRNYLITRRDKQVNFMHNTVVLPDNYKLKVHPDLVYTELEQKGKKLILLGDIYDFRSPEKSNLDILQDLIRHSLPEILKKSVMYAGRYVVIHIQDNSFDVFHDATGTRRVYYTSIGDEMVISSKTFIIADLLDLKHTQDPDRLAYYNSEQYFINLSGEVGNTSYFDEIRQLLPDFYLNIKQAKPVRFWPTEALEVLPHEEIIRECAIMLRGFVKAAAHRYSLMMGVTAGYDSRVVMSATRDIQKDMLYYLNIPENLEKSLDLKIHKKMFSGENLPSSIFRFREKAPEEFRKVYFENNPIAHPDYVDICYQYLLNYPNHVNLPGGVITVTKTVQRLTQNKPDGRLLAKAHHVDKFDFAVKYYQEYLEEAWDISQKTKINIFELSYHENLNNTMGCQLQTDKDIAQEEFIIFNSSYLVQRMLTYDFRQRNIPLRKLHTDLIKEMWPELLKYPLNPTFKNKAKKLLFSMNLFEPVLTMVKAIKQ